MSAEGPAQKPSGDFSPILEGLPNLDKETAEQAAQFYDYFKTHDPYWSESKASNVKRCAILVASKSVILYTLEGQEIRGNMISVSQLIRVSSNFDMNSIIHQLTEFVSIVKIPEPAHLEIKKLIKNFALSLMVYKKFQEKWNQLNLHGEADNIHKIFQSAWLLLIVSRAYLLNKTEDIYECGCLIIGVLHLVLSNLPNSITFNFDTDILTHLCSLLQANIEKASSWVGKIRDYASELRTQGILKSKGDSSTRIFAEKVIGFNTNSLGVYYQKSLDLNDIDERDLAGRNNKIATPVKNRVGMTPFTRRAVIGKGLNGRTLNWDENDRSININSNLNELPVPSSPFIVPPTPMTSAMEMNTWLSNTLDDHLEAKLKETCDSIKENLIVEIENKLSEMSRVIEKLFDERGVISINGNDRAFISQYFENDQASAPVSPKRNHKVKEIKNLYENSLIKLLKAEQEKSTTDHILHFILNPDFHQSLYSCCLESILYVYNVTSITFEEVLAFIDVSPFEFWKQINNFAKFDPTMPLQLKRHFKEIEIKILSHLA